MKRMWTVGLVALSVMVLPSCGGSKPAEPKPSVSPSGSASASPSAALNTTVPQGRYKVKLTLATARPSRQKTLKKSDRTEWKFKAATCDETVCTGEVRSKAGAEYAYSWDGTTLTLERPAAVQRVACIDRSAGEVLPGSGTMRVKYAYEVSSTFAEPPTATPQALNGTFTYRLTYRKHRGCRPTARDARVATYNFVATHR
ncbi:MAG: hypothetical protein V9E81_09685 [Marmoricola sp.]